MPWHNVRSIVLTCDPSWFSDGEVAYYELMEKKAIPQMIHNLNRTLGKGILDWVWILEWHKNGFPHWHLFCEVEKAGYAGQIGHSDIQKYWKYGFVHERPIKNQGHWDEYTKYFGKKGYFAKNKAHQAVLPEWAKFETLKKIRKYGSKRIDRPIFKPVLMNLYLNLSVEQLFLLVALQEIKLNESLTTSQINNKADKEEKRFREEYRKKFRTKEQIKDDEKMKFLSREPYCVILDRCGKTCVAHIDDIDGFHWGCSINTEYSKVIGWFVSRGLGKFEPRVGYVARMGADEFDMFENEFMKTSAEELLEQLRDLEDPVNF